MKSLFSCAAELARRASWVIAASLLFSASDAVWEKAPQSWTDNDVQQILHNSPWAKTMPATLLPLQNEAQRREGGDMGLPKGIGYDGIGDTRPRVQLPQSVFGKSPAEPELRELPTIRLTVRWEHALPIRVAQMKSGQTGAPISSENAYTIAVLGIPGTFFGDPQRLGNPLKSLAALKRPDKKDAKPITVEVYQLDSGAAAIYTFPKSDPITAGDASVTFVAQIGRLFVSHTFAVSAMQFDGKLEL